MFAVFESFTADKTVLTLQEICERIDLPKSTTFRIVRNLEEAGYLVRLDQSRYCLSLRFTRLAGFVNSTLDVRTVSRPVLQSLAEATGESVSIHMVSGVHRVCLDTVTWSGSPLRSVAQPGEHLPLGTGSVSKVLVAFLSKDAFDAVSDVVVANSGRSIDEWQNDIDAVRRLGHAVTHGDRQLGLSGISAPVFEVNGRSAYCLTVAGPTVRIEDRESTFVPLLTANAHSLSLQMGGDPAGDGIRKRVD